MQRTATTNLTTLLRDRRTAAAVISKSAEFVNSGQGSVPYSSSVSRWAITEDKLERNMAVDVGRGGSGVLGCGVVVWTDVGPTELTVARRWAFTRVWSSQPPSDH